MITALQNFISKKGKFVFVLLLFVVVISFVLYLAQGASVFDLLPDPNKEKKELTTSKILLHIHFKNTEIHSSYFTNFAIIYGIS